MNRLHRITPFAFALAASMASAAQVGAANPTTADCLSANDKSIALRNDHKLLAARAQLLMCASPSCPGDIRKECIKRIDLVNASIPTVVFEAKDESGNDLTAVTLKMDGEVIAERLEGMAVSLDPGAHTFTIDAIGQPTVTKQLIIREGQKDRREEIQIRTQTTATTPLAAPWAPAPAPTLPPAAPAAPPERTGLGAQKSVALVAVGIGVVGVGVGTIFGLQSMSKHNAATNECPTTACGTPAGLKLWDDAHAAGNLSTVGFVIGTAGLLGGAVLWLTAKPNDKPSMRAGVGPGSLQLEGSW